VGGDCFDGHSKFFHITCRWHRDRQVPHGDRGRSGIIGLSLPIQQEGSQHEALARRFTELSSKIASWDPCPQNLKKARAERLRIEKDKPPVRRLIDLQAQNEECRARDLPCEDLIPLSRSQRTFGYIGTFDMRRLEAWQAKRAAERLAKVAQAGPLA
jgi:hypothetical protein